MRPRLLLNIAVGLCFAFSLLFSGVHFYHAAHAADNVAELAKLPTQLVKTADLLSLLVTVSGITIPILIAYMLIKAKDLQVTISERAALHLEHNGVSLQTFRLARLVMEDNTNDLQATDAMKSLWEAVDLGRHEDSESLSDLAQSWLLPSEKLRVAYNTCFTSEQDRSMIEFMIYCVGLSAFLCFMDLYVQFEGFGLDLSTFDQFIIPMTASLNFLAYFSLVWIVRTKGRIRSAAFSETKKVCRQVKSEIDAAERYSALNQRNLKAALQAGGATSA